MEFNPPQPIRVLQGFVHPPEPAHRPSYSPNHIVGPSLPSSRMMVSEHSWARAGRVSLRPKTADV